MSDADDEFRDGLYDVDRGAPPHWLHQLSPLQRGWRDKQILKGWNPDPHIEKQFWEAGLLHTDDR